MVLNHKFGDPNYDIKQLALGAEQARMYPDILNYDPGGQSPPVRSKRQWAAAASLGVWENETASRVDGRNNYGRD